MSYSLFGLEERKVVAMAALWLVVVPLLATAMWSLVMRHDIGLERIAICMAGIVVTVLIWTGSLRTLSISETNITVRSPVSSLSMNWDEVTSIDLIRCQVSFSSPRRFVVSAVIVDSRGRRIRISGSVPRSEEIIAAIKAQVPDAVRDATGS